MKKLLTLVVIALAAVLPGQAQVKSIFGIANHLGVDLNVGTTGIGFEFSTPITPFIQARAGLSIMPGFNFNVDSEITGTQMVEGNPYDYSEEITLNSSLKRTQGSLIFNVYPFGGRSSFFVAVGGYFGGKNLLNITGKAPDAVLQYGNGVVEIGNYQIPVDKNGYVNGALRTNAFRPYFGIGTGRPCPGGRLNFMWELGLQVSGKPKVFTGDGEISEIPELDNDDTYNKIQKYLKVYPVLKFTISGRIF